MLTVTVLQRGAVSVLDYRCSAGAGAKPYTEVHAAHSLSFVRKGSFGYRFGTKSQELVAGAVLTGHAGDEFACTHEHHACGPGFVTSCRPEAGARVLTFANGFVAREVLVGIDDEARRVAYTVTSGFAQHHNASAQVFEATDNSTRFVWITDVLPDSFAEQIGAMMDQGVEVMRRALAPLLAER